MIKLLVMTRSVDLLRFYQLSSQQIQINSIVRDIFPVQC